MSEPVSKSKSMLRSAAALGLGTLVVLVLARPGTRSALVDHPAPDFSAPIVAGDGAGDRVQLSSFAGRVVLLDFWASWCPPCRASIPILSELSREQGEDGAIILGVNVEANQGERFVRQEHARLGAQFPSLLDADFQMQERFRVESLPSLFVVDRLGVVRYAHVGVPNANDLRRQIAELLNEHSPVP